MQNVKCKMRYWIVWGSLVSIIADRMFKRYAQGLPSGEVFHILPGIDFGYYLNPALFFFPAWRWIPWLALVILIAILGFWIWSFIRNWKLEIGNSYHQALLPIVLGGMSNVFDRFAYGGVIDYVTIQGVATANLADILILLGVIFLIHDS